MEEIILHYKTRAGIYPTNPNRNNLSAFFDWHQKAALLWAAYEKNAVAEGLPKFAYVKSGGRTIEFPPGSTYSRMSFDNGKVYYIASQNAEGVYLRGVSQTEISCFFKYSDVVLIYFSFNFFDYQ